LVLDLIVTNLSNLTRKIIKKYIETSYCFSAISSDGTTSNEFMVGKSDGLFRCCVLNTLEKKKFPSLVKTLSIAKNLDYYQCKICHLVPGLEDKSYMKSILQVTRVIIISALIKLVNILHDHISESSIGEWNLHSEMILIAASEYVQSDIQFRTKFQITEKILESTFSYLEIDYPYLETEICNLYGR
jgi:hypothetical protein